MIDWLSFAAGVVLGIVVEDSMNPGFASQKKKDTSEQEQKQARKKIKEFLKEIPDDVVGR